MTKIGPVFVYVLPMDQSAVFKLADVRPCFSVFLYFEDTLALPLARDEVSTVGVAILKLIKAVAIEEIVLEVPSV